MKSISNKLSLLSWLIFGVVAIIILFSVEAYAGTQQKDSSESVHNKNNQAKELMHEAAALEKTGALDQAIAIYEKLIREFPNVTYEDEIGEGKYSEDARIRVNVLRCFKARGLDFSTESRDELVTLLKEAFQNKNSDKLARYASCDFKVGKPETDAVWQLLPDQVVPGFVGLSEALDWSSASFDASGYLNLKTKTSPEEHIFALEQSPNGWRWVGYFTTDKKILDHLWKMRQKK